MKLGWNQVELLRALRDADKPVLRMETCAEVDDGLGFPIGRTAARKSLQRLERRGLVDQINGQSWIAWAITKAGIRALDDLDK